MSFHCLLVCLVFDEDFAKIIVIYVISASFSPFSSFRIFLSLSFSTLTEVLPLDLAAAVSSSRHHQNVQNYVSSCVFQAQLN